MTHDEYRMLLKTDASRAQRAVFDEYFNYVYVIVFNRLRSCGSREDIDECVSDVFVEVFSAYAPEMPLTGDIKGFIGVIAARRSTDYYRRLSGKPDTVSIYDENAGLLPAAADDDVQKAAEEKLMCQKLLEVIDSLGEPDSTIIMQKYFFGRSSKEISKILSLAPVSIRVRSARALKKLRKMLDDMGITL